MTTPSWMILILWLARGFSLVLQSRGRDETPSRFSPENIFTPKMDYDEWTPLGRGDPLKNDPTYDYVPPILERVHYWIDPEKRTPDPPVPDSSVSVLESSRKALPAIQAAQLKLNQSRQPSSRVDASPFLNPFYKFFDSTHNGISSNLNHANRGTPQAMHRPNIALSRGKFPQAMQRPPHTMLMPPPPPPSSQITAATHATVATATTTNTKHQTRPIEATTTATTTITVAAAAAAAAVTARSPTMLANTENVFKPVAISMPSPMKSDETNSIDGGMETEASSDKKTVSGLAGSLTGGEDKADAKKLIRFVAPKSSSHRNRGHVGQFSSSYRAGAAGTSVHQRQKESSMSPFYLIIEGHSKVKTYGASKNPVYRIIKTNALVDEDKTSENGPLYGDPEEEEAATGSDKGREKGGDDDGEGPGSGDRSPRTEDRGS